MCATIGTVAGVASVASAALGTKADTVSPGTAPSRRSPGSRDFKRVLLDGGVAYEGDLDGVLKSGSSRFGIIFYCLN